MLLSTFPRWPVPFGNDKNTFPRLLLGFSQLEQPAPAAGATEPSLVFAGIEEVVWITWMLESPRFQGDCCTPSLVPTVSPRFAVILMEQLRGIGRVGMEEERGSLPRE